MRHVADVFLALGQSLAAAFSQSPELYNFTNDQRPWDVVATACPFLRLRRRSMVCYPNPESGGLAQQALDDANHLSKGIHGIKIVIFLKWK